MKSKDGWNELNDEVFREKKLRKYSWICSEEFTFPFPYFYDSTQEIARAYGAECTPDFFVFDSSLHCVYRGQFDDSRPGNKIPVTGKDLQAALDAILEGRPVSEVQKPNTGCNIKWKS